MAGSKEIRNQIRSIKNTQKITRAMEMVAASKMRRAQERMRAARPYAEKIRQVIGHLAAAHPEYRHPFMEEREVKRAGFIIITSDKGLAGALNTNVLKAAVTEIRQLNDAGVEVDLAVIGNKGLGFFRRVGGRLVAELNGVGDAPHLSQLIGPVKVMLDAYAEGRIDRLYLIYAKFINTMSQRATVEQLLPIQAESMPERSAPWDYLYEPDPRPVLETLLTRYVESVVFQGMTEHAASEQSARMVAMKSASDNAKKLIGELQLVYNKARQAAITQEISEISAGAAAV
ncbi:F0F1 ATP synthase subunit gamma [Thermithiobacillus tepidarius DSM 3134]|uniref:F0F1 ATP synthase subunit gamma n=1 Tax=Thermithiobacillus tepidarius TaxID=929 RepID=UPI000425E6E0|nr:F0F1 ATP synthase subunit gamma [Thermithiobacillus tepidarius]